jgi:rare lipoprotein A
MRMLTNAILSVIAGLAVSITGAEAASQNWKQSCTGPEHACSSSASVAAAKTVKVAKARNQGKLATYSAAKTKKTAYKASKPKKQYSEAKKPAKVAQKKSKSTGGGSSYQSGVASWYGGKFHGRKTASGETYNQNSLTAAHRSLPFGTKVRVTNTNNGDTVVVRINDRGPFVGGRVIDLSRAAASSIGINGLGHVKLTVLGRT